MPIVRGRFIPEIEGAGRLKKYLDVLLWGSGWERRDWENLDEIEILRDYLDSICPSVCGIRLLVPSRNIHTGKILGKLSVNFLSVEIANPTTEISKVVCEAELASAVQTALVCDADALVVKNTEWLPYVQDLEALGLFLTDTSFLKYYCEIFVRGHEIPWSFASKIWSQTWNGFYHWAEQSTLRLGLDFLHFAQQKRLSAEAQETGRSLVNNRLPNICFTRDRLLFYQIQKMAARRGKWKRQGFLFEVGYFLNFYYFLIYGGFDHVALLVSQSLQLGLGEKTVGATYPSFLDALKVKNESLNSIFTDPKQLEFMKRIGYLRNYASHRGSVAPGKLLEKPDRELTDDELDAMISAAEMDDTIMFAPEGKVRESIRQMLRSNFRMAHYEKVGNPIEGVVFIKIDGKSAFIIPENDTYWNFQKFLMFMNGALTELKKCL